MQSDLKSQEENDTGTEKTKVTRINVFDHIRKRSRRLQALPCFGSTPTSSCYDQMDDLTSCYLIKTASGALNGPLEKKFKEKGEKDVLCSDMVRTKDSNFLQAEPPKNSLDFNAHLLIAFLFSCSQWVHYCFITKISWVQILDFRLFH